jgi:hypothetical protein
MIYLARFQIFTKAGQDALRLQAREEWPFLLRRFEWGEEVFVQRSFLLDTSLKL